MASMAASSIALPARAVIAGKRVSSSARTATPMSRGALKVSAVSYTVKSGDTVYSIAATYKVTPAAIASENKLDKNFMIQPDQTLQIPSASTTTLVGAPAKGLFGQLLSVKGAFVLALLLAAVFYKTNEGKKDE